MDENGINCIIGILLLVGTVIWASGGLTKPKPTEFKDLGMHEVPRERIDGMPLPGTRKVWRVQASDGDIQLMMNSGTTAQGNVTRTFTRIGRKTWQIGVVDWHTEPPSKPDGVSWDDYYGWLAKNGWKVNQ